MGFLGSLGFQGILGLFTQMMPVVSALVQIVEAANPAPGQGAKKFQTVMKHAQEVALAAPQVVAAIQASGKAVTDAAHSGDMAALSNGLTDIINLAVKTANSVGAFQKSGFVQGVTAAQNAQGVKQPNY